MTGIPSFLIAARTSAERWYVALSRSTTVSSRHDGFSLSYTAQSSVKKAIITPESVLAVPREM